MSRCIHTLAASIVATALAGCAAAPHATTPETLASASTAPGCAQLDADIARAEDARRAATEKEQNAWKAVVPFAVVVRHVSGKAAAGEAEQQLDALRAESTRHGCARHGR